MWNLVLAALAAFLASIVNAIAGGGTYITFPALTGPLALTAKAANVTSTVGLWPGYGSSLMVAWGDIRRLSRDVIWGYSVTGAVGGALGAILLITTPTTSFSHLIPWLLLFSTIVLALGPWISAWAKRRARSPHPHTPQFSLAVFPLLFVISIYLGYFGAGGGILLLAGLTVAGISDTHQMNTLKVLLQINANAAAVIVFLGSGIDWRIALAMGIGAFAGGFAGMASSRKIPALYVRAIILVIAATLTLIYFTRNR
jgi:uncharacterized membrane protein YfcA